jgi:tRNA A-37 threonylcarbamoyl transferase component Bud32/HAMP domain-containing protein
VQSVGRYVIERPIGEGAMADVYRAHDPSIDRVLAIKVLKPELRKDLGLVGRFLREARAAGALSHPNIVTIYDVGEADGFPYIAMELLDGIPLDEQLRDHGRMSFSDVAGIGAQVADALDYAHGTGIIHRDIKPSNIMLCASGRTAKILDFGIARMAQPDGAGAQATAARTQYGQVLGTPRYMSPEQAFGLELDHRSDLFSLGVVLYELITGQTAFGGTSIATLALQITQRKPEPLGKVVPGCPNGLQHVIDKLLAKQPDKRFSSGAEVAAALRREVEGANLAAEGRRRLPLQVRLTLLMGAAVGVALLLSIATVLDRQYKAMEQMTLTSGTTIASFVANNVALRTVENAGLSPAEQDWLPVQAFVAAASRDSGIREIVVVDASGVIRGSTDAGRIGRPYRAIDEERNLALDGDQRVTATGAGDFRFVRTIRYSDRPFGQVEVVTDHAGLDAAASSSRNLLIGLGVALLLIVLALSYLIGQSVARPVERLRRALEDAAAGHRDFRISHGRRDPFGEVFDAFNRLAESLDQAGDPTDATTKASLEATRIGPIPVETLRRA